MKHRTIIIMAGMAGLVAGIVHTPGHAAATPPGARAGDKTMTCEAVAKERDEIESAVFASAEKALAKKKRKSLFGGLAKSFMGVAAPGMIGSMGGSTVAGNVAARAASQTAGEAIYQSGRSGAEIGTPAAPAPTPDQQVRLDRLAKIAAFRQCAEG